MRRERSFNLFWKKEPGAQLSQSLPELYWDTRCLISCPLPAAISIIMVWQRCRKQVIGWWLVVHQFGLFLSNLATQVFPAPVLMSRSNKFHNILSNLPNLTTPCSFFAAAMRRLQYHGLAVRQTSSSWTQVYIPDTSLALALMSRPKMFRNV